IKRMKSITRYSRPRKPATVNRELAILSGIFGWPLTTRRSLRIRVKGDGRRFITRDVDSHSGGVWKMFDRNGRRLGTYDAN
ncbi:MAG TPA: toxin C-terminal domain-containing protein, partial [Pyrinomonadaceae bacterium]|nr:toxin C-terminal domain-containing protein [Pyrinomonadaceae bacterium]